MHKPTEHKQPHGAKSEQTDVPYDPHTKRGPPQRLEDTDAAGDALNGTGEDNQHCKENE
jgi:hypothetical protein